MQTHKTILSHVHICIELRNIKIIFNKFKKIQIIIDFLTFKVNEMPLLKQFIDELECCLRNDGHIVIDPVLLKCGGNACKSCINNIQQIAADCKSCKKTHEKKDLLECTSNRLASTLVEYYLSDLFEYVDKKVEYLTQSLKG